MISHIRIIWENKPKEKNGEITKLLPIKKKKEKHIPVGRAGKTPGTKK